VSRLRSGQQTFNVSIIQIHHFFRKKHQHCHLRHSLKHLWSIIKESSMTEERNWHSFKVVLPHILSLFNYFFSSFLCSSLFLFSFFQLSRFLNFISFYLFPNFILLYFILKMLKPFLHFYISNSYFCNFYISTFLHSIFYVLQISFFLPTQSWLW
jgi:hypothetical protein